ncbi:MAG: peptidylprolyl isomerase [Candidatus Omnitrophota bacterium]
MIMPCVLKRLVAVGAIIVIFSSLTGHAEVVDKIVVIVNDEIITQGDIDSILMPIYWQYKDLYSGQELASRLDEARRNVLQKMIQDKLFLTEAQKRGIEVDEKSVREKIDELKKRFSTEEDFKNALARENMMESELEKKYRERIMIDTLVEREIRRRVSVSPSEVLAYYDLHKADYLKSKEMRLRSLLIKVNETRNEERAERFAKIILRRLKEGGDFALLARRYSDGPYADVGGDMGWVREGELMKRIDELVFNMEIGEISGLLKTDLGFHIFKVEEVAPVHMREFNEVKEDIEKLLFGSKSEKNLKEWLERIKEDAYIAFR